MKAVVAAFNQEKALVGAFSVITNLRMELFEALPGYHCISWSPLHCTTGSCGVWVSGRGQKPAKNDGGKEFMKLVLFPPDAMSFEFTSVWAVQRRMGRKLTDGGLLIYRKWVPQQLGDVADIQPTNGSVAQRQGSQSQLYSFFGEVDRNLTHFFWSPG